MSVRPLLTMGDERLLQTAVPVTDFSSVELSELIQDMHDTMQAHDGAGLAAPQIGAALRVVIFGGSDNVRYPERPEVPYTVLINPHIDGSGN